MSAALVLTATSVGLAALVNAQGSGVEGRISHLAIGRGAGGAAASQTQLRQEIARVPILTASRIGPAGWRVTARIEPAAPSAPIFELGVLLADGTLLALWSDPAAPLAFRTAHAAIDLAVEFDLIGLPVELLTVTVTDAETAEPLIPLAGLVAALARLADQHLPLCDRVLALESRADPQRLLLGLVTLSTHLADRDIRL